MTTTEIRDTMLVDEATAIGNQSRLAPQDASATVATVVISIHAWIVHGIGKQALACVSIRRG